MVLPEKQRCGGERRGQWRPQTPTSIAAGWLLQMSFKTGVVGSSPTSRLMWRSWSGLMISWDNGEQTVTAGFCAEETEELISSGAFTQTQSVSLFFLISLRLAGRLALSTKCTFSAPIGRLISHVAQAHKVVYFSSDVFSSSFFSHSWLDPISNVLPYPRFWSHPSFPSTYFTTGSSNGPKTQHLHTSSVVLDGITVITGDDFYVLGQTWCYHNAIHRLSDTRKSFTASRYQSVRLHARFSRITAIVRLRYSTGQLQLSECTCRWENRITGPEHVVPWYARWRCASFN